MNRTPDDHLGRSAFPPLRRAWNTAADDANLHEGAFLSPRAGMADVLNRAAQLHSMRTMDDELIDQAGEDQAVETPLREIYELQASLHNQEISRLERRMREDRKRFKKRIHENEEAIESLRRARDFALDEGDSQLRDVFLEAAAQRRQLLDELLRQQRVFIASVNVAAVCFIGMLVTTLTLVGILSSWSQVVPLAVGGLALIAAFTIYRNTPRRERLIQEARQAEADLYGSPRDIPMRVRQAPWERRARLHGSMDNR